MHPASNSAAHDKADYIKANGNAGIGARLRRVSDRIDRDACAVYAHLGIKFEQRWMGVLRLLDERGDMTVGELADALLITQPSVSQTLRSLKAAKMISEISDRRDRRRRIQRLTKLGNEFVDQVRPVWAALIEATRVLDREGIDLITPLDRLENLLDQKSLFDRALEHLTSRNA